MGLFLLLNCLVLATGPFAIIYKCSGLTDYSGFWKCAQVCLGYGITQLVKMIALATFFPPLSGSGSIGLGILFEVFNTTVNLLDLIGIYIILQYLPGKGDFKIITTSMGWAATDLIFTKYVPIWFGTRGLEFDWTYIQLSFEANLDLVYHFLMVTLVWLVARKDLNQYLMPVVVSSLSFIIYRQIIFRLLTELLSLSSGVTLFINTVVTLLLGCLGLHLRSCWRGEASVANGGKLL